MNIGSIKSFLGGQDAVKPDLALDKQLQESGLRQAREFYQKTENSISSRFTVAFSAVSESMRQNVKLDGQSPERSKAPKDPASEKESVFDFEEIANNVMKFVGRVIRGAANSGASDEKLSSLFEQAREGVGRGIDAAKKDLSAYMDDELSEGIENVTKALEERMVGLEEEIFARDVSRATTQVSLSSTQSAEFYIRTQDGDEISLTFGQHTEVNAGSEITSVAYESDGEDSQSVESSTYVSYLEQLGVSLTVTGDIDEAELKAIADLTGQVSVVANEFFNGDVTKAFENAQSLGFDDSEIVSFSLDLAKQQTISAVRAYEDVQRYKEVEQKPEIPDADLKSINDYVDKMLASMDQASKALESKDDFNALVNGIVNSMDDDVKTPDLIAAINRFYQFNERIINAVAQQKQGSE